MRHFYSLNDFSREETSGLIDRAEEYRRSPFSDVLKRKEFVLLFLDPSLRTRCSFEVAIRHLGGGVTGFDAASLWRLESDVGVVMDKDKAEHVNEAVGVLCRYFDGIGVRCFARGADREEDLQDRAFGAVLERAKVPTINMESAMYHPCQALADLQTIRRLLGELQGRKVVITWAFHPRPLPMAVANSILLATTKMGMEVTLAHPPGFNLHQGIIDLARANVDGSGGALRIVHDQAEGAEEAEIVYAKSWGAMLRYEDPDAEQTLREAQRSWIVNRALMDRTKRGYFMHCLPVRRNVVVTDDVIDSAQSVVLDQAENRLHSQKAVLEWLCA